MASWLASNILGDELGFIIRFDRNAVELSDMQKCGREAATCGTVVQAPHIQARGLLQHTFASLLGVLGVTLQL